MKQILIMVPLLVAIAAGTIGCETKAQTGALVGGAGGAALGGAIGSMSHARAGEGALIGAAVGAIGGGLVGHGMDKADEKKAREQDRYYAERDYDRRHANSRAEERSEYITKNDVIDWTRRGVREEIIVDRIERGNTVFRLTAADINDLRDSGVSESVIRSMKDTARR